MVRTEDVAPGQGREEALFPTHLHSRPPSQKELACVLQVTTRHLRRWEAAAASSGHPCSRPYTAADLWQLYGRRRGKGWDRHAARRLHLEPLFQHFDHLAIPIASPRLPGDRTYLPLLLLDCLALEEGAVLPNATMSRTVADGLALSARAQLRAILSAEPGRQLLARAFLEGAALADARTCTAGNN